MAIAVSKVGIVIENDDAFFLDFLVLELGAIKVSQGPTAAFPTVFRLVEFGRVKLPQISRCFSFSLNDLHGAEFQRDRLVCRDTGQPRE